MSIEFIYNIKNKNLYICSSGEEMLVFPPVVINSSFGRFPGAVTR